MINKIISILMSVVLCYVFFTTCIFASGLTYCDHENLEPISQDFTYSWDGASQYHDLLIESTKYCQNCDEYIEESSYEPSLLHTCSSKVLSHRHIVKSGSLDEHEYEFQYTCPCGYTETEIQITPCAKGGNDCVMPYKLK